MSQQPTQLDDAQALQAAAEHIETAYPGMAALMRRCASRLYQAKSEIQQLRDALEVIGGDEYAGSLAHVIARASLAGTPSEDT
jgi:hypothetical protein